MAKRSKNLGKGLPSLPKQVMYPHLKKMVKQIQEGLRIAAKAGQEAMQNKILNSPTYSARHNGRRYNTGTMFESVGKSNVKTAYPDDKRMRGSASVSFGFPAYPDGRIKDAPTNPSGPPREESLAWRSDPNYFVMQEYGDSMFDEATYPGMFSQAAGYRAAVEAFETYLKRKKIK